MANYVTFFPVGNGDMTLFSTEDKVNFLIDKYNFVLYN